MPDNGHFDTVPGLIPGGGHPIPDLLGRPDVLLHRGRFSLLNTGLTPAEATEQDLLFVKDVLDKAGIDHLLIRGNDARPVLAINRRDRKVLATALGAAMADEPFYATITRKKADTKGRKGKKSRSTQLVADGALDGIGSARLVHLFRPRVELHGGLTYGRRESVVVQLWKFSRHRITAPVDNTLTRREINPGEVSRTTVVRHGRTWSTLTDMFEPRMEDIDFPIDLVFSWVDGSSLEWQRVRAKKMAAYVVGEGDDSEARFRQLDELKYALRSVNLFAPWVRRIYIVTDSPRPSWLAEQDRVTIVPNTEFFSDTSVLPIHNSMAVESQLQHIPGISEHFIYSNDDMFFGRPVGPDMFFTAGGVSSFIQSVLRVGVGGSRPDRSGFENSARVNRELLRRRFGAVIVRHLEHAPTPVRKSVLLEMEAEFAEDFARTRASVFRAMTDISVTNSLYHYYALRTGRAYLNTSAKVSYIDTTARAGLVAMNDLLGDRDQDFFCLNDGSFPEVTAEHRAEAVRSFLDRYYPIAAPWELPESETAAGSTDLADGS
ncbi:sugar phosphotransferase [Nakamurella silvestris]|nr:sugar phosphotransferase [Nakamurella silvestris]